MRNELKVMRGAQLLIALLIMLAGAPARAQQPSAGQTTKEVLTNASVIELVKLGLSEALIAEKIRQSEHNFDTSVEGLRQLKAARISEALIREMMSPRAYGATPMPPVNDPSSNNKAVPTREPGIYAVDKGRVTQLQPTTFSGTKNNFMGAALSGGFAKSKVRASVRGASANLVLAESRPEFYFYFDEDLAAPGLAMTSFAGFSATSPAEFVLVKMERKSNSRETVLMEIGMFGSSTGARDKDIREFSFEKLRAGVFKVTPKAALDAGEYCFYFAGAAGAYGFAGGKLFDFSLAPVAR